MSPRATAAPVAPVRGRLFKTRDAATYLGVSERGVRTLIARGEIAAMRNRNGRLIGIYETDCDAWITDHRQRTASAVSPAEATVDDRIRVLMPKERVF